MIKKTTLSRLAALSVASLALLAALPAAGRTRSLSGDRPVRDAVRDADRPDCIELHVKARLVRGDGGMAVRDDSPLDGLRPGGGGVLDAARPLDDRRHVRPDGSDDADRPAHRLGLEIAFAVAVHCRVEVAGEAIVLVDGREVHAARISGSERAAFRIALEPGAEPPSEVCVLVEGRLVKEGRTDGRDAESVHFAARSCAGVSR